MNWLRKKKEEFLEKSIFGKIWFIVKKLILLFFVTLVVWILWETTQPICRSKVNRINEKFVNNIIEYMKREGGYKRLSQDEVNKILRESGCEIETAIGSIDFYSGDLSIDFSCSNFDIYGNFIQRKEFNNIYIYFSSNNEPKYLFKSRYGIYETWDINSSLKIEKRHSCSADFGWGP